MEKFSRCLDLGLDVVAQEVNTEEYSTYPISPETEVETKEVIGNKM